MKLLPQFILEIIMSLFMSDYVNIHIDTYGDARNNIGLTANLYGSQADGIRVNLLVLEAEIAVGVLMQILILKSLGRLTDLDMKLKFIIPFSALPFPNGKTKMET